MSRAALRVQCLPCRLLKGRDSGAPCMKLYDGSHETTKLPSGGRSAPSSLTVSPDFSNEGISGNDDGRIGELTPPQCSGYRLGLLVMYSIC